MKYHSNITTVLISIAVLLLFAAASCMILFELNLTSPTLIVADNFFKDFENTDSDITFQFSNVERNLKDRVRFSNLSVAYKTLPIATFDSLEIKLGVLDFVKYVLTGKNYAKLELSNGVISIPQTLLNGAEGKGNFASTSGGFKISDIKLPQVLEKYQFQLDVDSFVLRIGEIAEFQDVAASVGLKGSLDSLDVALFIPKFSFNYQGYQADLDYIGFTFAYQDEYILKAMVDDLGVTSDRLKTKVNDFYVSFHFSEDETISLENAKGRVGFENLTGHFDKSNFGLNEVAFSFEKDLKTLAVHGITAEEDQYSISVLDSLITTKDFDHYETRIVSLAATDSQIEVGAKSLFGVAGINDKTAQIEASSVLASNLSFRLNKMIESVEISKLVLNASYTDHFNVGYSFNLISSPVSEILSSLRFSSHGEVSFSLKELLGFEAHINEFYPGVGVELASLFVHGDLKQAEYEMNYGSSLASNGTFSILDKSIGGNLNFLGLRLQDFNSIFGNQREIIENVTSLNTNLKGDITFEAKLNPIAKYGFEMETDFDLLLNEIHYNTLTSNFETKGHFLKDNKDILFPSFEIISDYAKAKFSGVFDLDEMLPNMTYEVNLNNGTPLLKGDLNLVEEKKYHYHALIPRFTNSYIDGYVDFKKQDAIVANSDFKTGKTMREFTLDINLIDKSILLKSPKISIRGSYSDGIKLNAVFNHLDTVVDGYGRPIYIDGRFTADFDKGGKHFSLNTEDFSISDIWFFPSRPTLSFDFDGNENLLSFNNIKVLGADNYAFLGQSKYEFDKKSFTIRLDEMQSEGQILMSIFKDEAFSGILRGENLDLTIFGFNGMVGNINLSGRAAKLQDFTFTGNMEALSTDAHNDSRKLTGKISIDPAYIAVRELAFTNTGVDAAISSIDYNAEMGDFAISGIKFNLKNEHKDRDYPIRGEFSIYGKLQPQESIYAAVFNTMRNRGEGVTVGIDIKNLDFDNSVILVADKQASGIIKNGVLELSGNLANGSVDLNDFRTKVDLDLLPLAKLNLDMNIKEGIEGNVRIDGFNMYAFNFFFQAPLLVFKENMLFGEVGITETSEGYNLKGNLSSDELSLEIFWAPNQLVTLHKPTFTIWDNDVRTSLTATTVLNYEDYTRNAMNMIVAIGFSPSLSFEGYEAEMFIDEDSMVEVRIPLPDTNIDIAGKLNGHYKFTGYNGKVTNDGYLNLYDTTISIGMNPYPEWYGISGEMFIDLLFNFTKNNRITYPAGPNPMVSIVVADNDSLDFHLGRDGIKVAGELTTRGGEIFYFNKYFYIVDGRIGFPDKDKLDPRISLRASLRDFDANGDKVEIYLVIKNSSFSNLNPIFESTPQKDISEIMSILGQNILSSNTYGNVSASSMAALVTESVDVLSKLGIIKGDNASANLNNSMKEILKLDSFSIHSNIVNNIVSDTIANASISNIDMYSPMARYLNGTTLNLGKYLSPNLYFQAMVYLDATKKKNAYKVFADDLALETELSLEWINDAFTVTFFSNPKYLSFYSLMDTFGITVKKTIKF